MSAVRCLAYLTVLAVPMAVNAEPLADVLAKVYATNPRLLAGRASLQAVDEAVPRARAGRRPQLGLTSQAVLDAVDTNETSTVLQTLRQALNLTQSLYSGGETTALIARAESAVQAERARLVQLEQEILLQAIAAYTAVTRDQAVLDLARRNEERMRIQLDSARDRERFGDVTKTDVAQARSRHARATAERIRAEGDLKVSVSDYRRLVGERPGRLTQPSPPEGLPHTLEEALVAVEDSPVLQAAFFELATARDDVAIALAALKPRLTLNGEISYTDEPSTLLDRQSNASIGATLAVPLFQGGGENARVRQSKDVLSQRRYDVDDARRTAEAAITAAWEDLRTTEAQIRSIQVQTDAAAFALEGVRQEALVGARSVLDVLDAEQELFAAEVDLVRAERERLLATYRLQAATGRLTARDLELDVEMHDPRTHYEKVRGKWFGLGPAIRAD